MTRTDDDCHGWDYLIEWHPRTSVLLSADRQPSVMSAFVQAKETRACR